MRIAAIALSITLCAGAASAANTQLTLFSSNLSLEGDSVGTRWHGGFGLALSRSWTHRWSTELAVATQRHSAGYVEFLQVSEQSGPAPVTVRREFHVYPADLTTQYRFTNSSRWTPYVSGGFRYVASPTHSHPAPAGSAIRGGFQFGGDR